MSVSDASLGTGEQVSFIQYYLPGLPTGNYQLTVAQQVADASHNQLNPDDPATYSNTYAFAVQGDRFRLSQPASVVYTTFPAANAVGEFGAVLPHVVFVKKTFPWSRSPLTGGATAPTPGATVPTWLTVLVLDATDKALCSNLQLPPQQATVADLFPQSALPAGSTSSLGANLSYFQGATDTSGLDVGQALTDAIQVLDMPLPLFWQLAPSLTDLAYAAHARQVSLVSKATLPGISDVGEPRGDFSIVVGNRLAQAGQKSTAYLVSLEGQQALLPNADDSLPAGYAADDTRFIRLAVLQSWSYYSTGEQGTFTDTLQALNGRVAGPSGYAPEPAARTTLTLPYAGNNTLVANALGMGYAPLNHHLRNGGTSVSWYRGPLVPSQGPAGQVAVPLASADQATRFDPTTGLLDTSYTAAWTLGRWLALQDKAFSTALYQWKTGLQQQVLRSIENSLLSEPVIPPPPAAAAPAHLGAEAARLEAGTTRAEEYTATPVSHPTAPRRLGYELQRQLLVAISQ